MRPLEPRPLPELREDISFSPFDADGSNGKRFLIEAGATRFVASEQLHELLQALATRPESLDALANAYETRTGRPIVVANLEQLLYRDLPETLWRHAPDRVPHTPIVWRVGVIPERLTGFLAARMTWLFHPAAVLALVPAFLFVEWYHLRNGLSPVLGATPHHVGAAYLVVLVSVLVHELGHAAACARYKCAPGEIGFGLYWILPVFYADVSRAWRLPARQRAVVDAGGLYFQSVFVAGLGAYGIADHSTFVFVIVSAITGLMLYTLNPVLKMDGYWLLSDLTGIPNLHKRLGEATQHVIDSILTRPVRRSATRLSRRSRMVLAVYAVVVACYGVFLAVVLVRLAGFLALDYPPIALSHWNAMLAAFSQGDNAGTGRELKQLFFASTWPMLIGAVLLSKMLPRRR